MKYRIRIESGKFYVDEGAVIPTFYMGEPLVQWRTLESFYTELEAKQFMAFKQSGKVSFIEYLSKQSSFIKRGL